MRRIRWKVLASMATVALSTASSAADAIPGAASQASSAPSRSPKPAVAPAPAPAPTPAPASSAADAVTVLEFSSTAPVAFSTVVPKFQRRLVMSIAPRKEKTHVTVATGALEGRDGTTIPLDITPATAKPAAPAPCGCVEVPLVSGQQSFEVRLVATLPQQGDYTGYVSLKLGDGAVQLRSIKVTYALLDIPVQAGAVYRVAGKHAYSPDGALGIQLSGPSDGQLTGVTATVRELQRMPSPSEKVAARYRVASLTTESYRKEVTLDKGVPQAMYLNVDDLEAGSYTGKLTLAAPGYKAKDETVAFVIRSSWFLAFILVTVGAGVSAAIQHYATFRQPRLVVRDGANRLEREMDDLERQLVLDRDESAVMQRLRDKVDDYFEQSYQGSLPKDWLGLAQTGLKVVEGKLEAFPDWVDARRALAEVDLPAANRAALQKDLDDSQAAIEGDTELGAAAKATLDGLLNKIQAARRDALTEPVTVLSGQIDKEASTTSSVVAGKEFAAAKSAADAAIRALTVSDIPAYRARFDEAGIAYARGKGLELESHLPTPATPQWDSVRQLLSQLSAASDARTADVLYNQAYDAFTKVQAAAAADDLTMLQGAGGGPKVDSALADAMNVVRSARASSRAFGFALEDFRTLADGRNKALDILGPGAGLQVKAAFDVPERGAAVPNLPGQLMTQRFNSASRRRARNRGAAGRELRWYDYLITGVAVIASGVLGVVLIWVPDNDWGQVSDFLAAVLWGLGLHTVGSSTFIGIAAVKNKLTGTSTT